jgi:hypothetical protein
LPFSLPKEYASLPHLVGRATVVLTVEKADSSLAFIDNVNGGLSKQAKVRGSCWASTSGDNSAAHHGVWWAQRL